MKTLHTIVCAALLAGFAPSSAQSNDTHPVLQKRPPREVLNSDLLALPEREREAWTHGAVAQMAQTLAESNPEGGRCVLYWYFEEGNGAEIIPLALARYPDARPTSTIWALVKRACPQL